MMESRCLALAGCVFGFVGVAAGAFGAHALKARLAPEMLAVFETGVRYQMYHALALLLAAWAFSQYGHGWIGTAGYCFMSGMIIFSGSLYILALSGVKIWGAVTPLGGLLLLGGWALFAAGILKSKT